MTNRGIQPADTRAAPAALARPPVPELDTFDRYLLIDDSDEDTLQIMTVLCERHSTQTVHFWSAIEQ